MSMLDHDRNGREYSGQEGVDKDALHDNKKVCAVSGSADDTGDPWEVSAACPSEDQKPTGDAKRGHHSRD